mmetsp:Transcript_29170/g.74840  ORF Transcript_29170/g.74840 Transcript_29170/m.74840 type:complete len:239 (-) Transcript_29170:484-1200(-)
MAHLWMGSRAPMPSPVSVRKPATLVALAAKPTSEWKAATSCGSSVTSTILAMPKPVAPPTPTTPSICRNASGGTSPLEAMTPSVAARPRVTPVMPSLLPSPAVDWLDRPPMAPRQARPEVRYAISVIAAKEVALPLVAAAAAAYVPSRPAAMGTYTPVASTSPSRLNMPSMRSVITKPPKMLTHERPTERAASQPGALCGTRLRSISSSPPAAVMPLMALVTDMRGECSEWLTPHTRL